MVRLEMLRRIRGLTQVELAKQIQVPQSFVSLLESQKIPLSRVQPDKREALEALFEHPLGELMEPLQA